MSRAILQLSKTGDILSALRIAQAAKIEHFVVSKQYADVIQGIPGITPHIYDGDWDDLRGALKFAKRKFKTILVTQTHARDIPIKYRTPGFQLDQQVRAGIVDVADCLTLPRPDNATELAMKYLPQSRHILVADQSQSSPFPHTEDLLKIVAEKYPYHMLVKLSEIKLDRFRDFLALYDAADLIITIDTAHLHLSAATKTPVIAFATDQPRVWHGSSDSARFAFYCRYGEYLERKPEFIHAMEQALEKKSKPEITLINTAHSHSYNPSQIRHEGKLFTSYRWHRTPESWKTELTITDGSKTWPVVLPEQFKDMSHEDMRLFLFKDKLYASYTVSQYGALPPVPCIVGYGRLEFTDDKCFVRDHAQIKYGKNNFDGQEKNHVYFKHGQNLHCIYQCGPEQIVLELNAGAVSREYKTKTPPCPFGWPRGGTQPVPYRGMWLRFCHSQSVNKPDRGQWMYHLVAVLQESSPPFQIMAVSKYPILTGAEHPWIYGHAFWKSRIAIPYGMIQDGDLFRVSIGINDSLCCSLAVRESDLNL